MDIKKTFMPIGRGITVEYFNNNNNKNLVIQYPDGSENFIKIKLNKEQCNRLAWRLLTPKGIHNQSHKSDFSLVQKKDS